MIPTRVGAIPELMHILVDQERLQWGRSMGY